MEILNDQFSSAFSTNKPTESDSQMAGSGKWFEGIDSSKFSSTVIESLLRKLDRRKPAGVDKIHPFILSECSSSLSLHISLIFSKSYDEGKIPVSWSLANISPIFKKKGSKVTAENYRHVSLSSVLCKVMEKIIRSSMLGFLVSNELISPDQH